MKKFAVFLLSLFLFSACGTQKQIWLLDTEELRPLIDAKGFGLTTIEPYIKTDEGKPIMIDGANPDNSMINASIKFRGRVIVSGTYTVYGREVESSLRDATCFSALSSGSLEVLPTVKGDNRKTSFCINNDEQSIKAFSAVKSGKSTVMIENYTINLFGDEVYNTAKLVTVGSKQINDLWGLDIGFKFQDLLVKKDNGEGFEFLSAQENPWTVIIAHQIKDFKRISDGFDDYAISQKIKDRLTSEDPCAVLLGGGLQLQEIYIPVDINNFPALCKGRKSAEGLTVISLVGVLDAFEGVPTIDGMLLVVRSDDAIMLSRLIRNSDIKAFQADWDKTLKDYQKAHPKMEFPGKEYEQLYKIMEKKLVDAIKRPDPELRGALDYLEGIAATIN